MRYSISWSRGARGFLGPVEAVREGFSDIKAHQMAVMAGMRAAFNDLMRRFDPDVLAESFDRHRKGGSLLGLAGKSRYWEMYVELYQQLTRDADDNFQRLFGDEFARAYEEQMDRLVAAVRAQGPR